MVQLSEIAFVSALDLAGLYRDKALSPVEAAEALFARLDALEPKLNAFCVVDRDGALAAARDSERRWLEGRPLGPLDGVPATIKDLVPMRGFPTRRGSRLIDATQEWAEDGPAVARLREAGAVIMGKTTTPEFGWKAIGDSPLTGITRNPWDLQRTPGGSSAGAAAACAGGIAPLHVGSDGAGSIRIPASFTGIFGMKATFGRVPAHPPSPMGLLSNVGPLTRSPSAATATRPGSHSVRFSAGKPARMRAAPAVHRVSSMSRGDGKIAPTSSTCAPSASNCRAAAAQQAAISGSTLA